MRRRDGAANPMLIAGLLLAFVFAVAVIYYAQRQLTGRPAARLVLLAAGIGVGFAVLHINGQYPTLVRPFTAPDLGIAPRWLNAATRLVTLVVGLALVHFPAAGILFLKKQGPFIDHRDHLD